MTPLGGQIMPGIRRRFPLNELRCAAGLRDARKEAPGISGPGWEVLLSPVSTLVSAGPNTSLGFASLPVP